MTISQAARTALAQLGRPATATEIFDMIQREHLYEFGAKEPIGVLGSVLRRHTKGSKTLKGAALFQQDSKGQYELV